MAQPVLHNPLCGIPLRDIHAGYADEAEIFVNTHINIPNFDLECMGCCLLYLTQERLYLRQEQQFPFVVFSNVPLGNRISSFVKVPGGGARRGQIATLPDPMLGIPSVRAFVNSRTYQLYTAGGNLSVGFPTTARLESVAIDVVRPDELAEVYFNYTDGALIELYRQQRNMPSLRGFCWVPTIYPFLPNFQNLALQ